MTRRAGALALGLTVLAGAVVLLGWARWRFPTRPLAEVGYVGSDGCVECHEGRYDSWHRTYHRTMTQPATATSVVGDFSGATLRYLGVETRFSTEGGKFFITVGADRFEVSRTVGSRRMQQYLTRQGDRFVRLPVAWLIDERRWTHLNAVFFDPDGTPFDGHRALWNANCVFCHNVKANPGYDWEKQTFDTKVEELGIACEACHGPGAEHVRRLEAAPALVKLRLVDAEIVSPRKLPPERQNQLCGHCHGQRLPDPEGRIREFLSQGDPYTPGEDLRRYVRPIQADSTLPGVELSLRFWKDGTPRLSAYEYQALGRSDAHVKAGVTCLSCHSAHEGDPRGLITEEKRGPAACTGCHQQYATTDAAAKHSGHRAGSVDCYGCHMPRIAFGIRTAHPTHQIASPDPSRGWRFGMPEACTLCHVDKPLKWAAIRLVDRGYQPGPLPQTFEYEQAESVRGLLAGDPVRRAISVLSLANTPKDAPPLARVWTVPFLLLAMEDSYPVVRSLAGRSLEELLKRPRLEAPGLFAAVPPIPDPLAPEEERKKQLEAWRAFWSALDKGALPPLDPSVPLDERWQPKAPVIAALRALRSDVPISVGE